MKPFLFGAFCLLGAVACTPVPPVKSLALVDGDIIATAPAGYCVDPGASNAGNGFAVMAPCATLGGNDSAPVALGVATVQVGPPDSGTVTGAEEALRGLLASSAGAVLLSPDGEAEAITVIKTDVEDNTVTVHFSDEGPPPIAGLATEEWRAFTDINGRLVTVAIRGLATAPLPDGTGAWLLDLVVTGLLANDSAPAADTPEV